MLSEKNQKEDPRTIVWGNEVKALRLGLRLDKDEYNPRDPITLEIYITNESAESVTIVETHILREHSIDLFSNGDQPVARTEQGQLALEAAQNLEFMRRISVTIDPAGFYKVVPAIRLDSWFHLDDSGSYRVHVQRRKWQNDQGRTLGCSAMFSIVRQEGGL